MTEREWTRLTGAPVPWGRLAAALDAGSGALEAVFDDAGRAGIAFAPGGDVATWGAWTRALAADGLAFPDAPPPARALAFFEEGHAGEAWAFGAGPQSRAIRLGRGAALEEGPLEERLAAGMGEPSFDALLKDFGSLHPLSGLILGLNRLEARVVKAMAWPFFARCEVAKPFAARPAFWARRFAALGVTGFALGRGRMEIFVQ